LFRGERTGLRIKFKRVKPTGKQLLHLQKAKLHFRADLFAAASFEALENGRGENSALQRRGKAGAGGYS